MPPSRFCIHTVAAYRGAAGGILLGAALLRAVLFWVPFCRIPLRFCVPRPPPFTAAPLAASCCAPVLAVLRLKEARFGRLFQRFKHRLRFTGQAALLQKVVVHGDVLFSGGSAQL